MQWSSSRAIFRNFPLSKSRLLFLLIYNRQIQRISPAYICKARKPKNREASEARKMILSLFGLKFGLKVVFLSPGKGKLSMRYSHHLLRASEIKPAGAKVGAYVACRATVKKDCLGEQGKFSLPRKVSQVGSVNMLCLHAVGNCFLST